MPKTYLLVEFEVTEPDVFATYATGVPERANIGNHGGHYLVRATHPEMLEGNPRPSRTVIIEFENRDRLLEWYNSPAYQELSVIRRKSSNCTMMVLNGTDS
jgi:uncharacterized protein (DUF1330 family)